MDFVLGSELEVCLSNSRVNTGWRDDVRESLVQQMRRAGFATNGAYATSGADKYTKWSVHGDSSIYSPTDHRGVEFVSPCLPAEEYFGEVTKMLNWLGNDIVTNRTTGFHHGISLANQEDANKLRKRAVLFMYAWGSKYESEEQTRWNRHGNEYCQPIMPRINATIRNRRDMMEPSVTDYDTHRRFTMVADSFTNLPSDLAKYYTLNCTKMSPSVTHSSYVECRVMGNQDYHCRMNDVLTTLSRVMECMELAVDDQSARELFANFILHIDHTAGGPKHLKLVRKLEETLLG